MANVIDERGNIYGRLTVMEHAGINKHGQQLWLCKCSCGNEATVFGGHLRSGDVKSCGCLKVELLTKHGLSKTRGYKSWVQMLQRCRNPNSPYYERYGGRGIKVCDEWLDFTKFLEDMGERPANTSLERINNNEGYCLGNCIWAGSSRQSFNQRKKITNKSGRTGVYACDSGLRWEVSIGVKGKMIRLGTFYSFEEAVKAREEAEMKYHGFIKE